MSGYLLFPLMVAIALLQSSVVAELGTLGVKPNLMLVAMVCLGMIKGTQSALKWGLLGGLLLDIFSGAPLGISISSLAPVGLLTWLGERKVMESDLLLALLLVFIGTLLYSFLFLLILQTLGSPTDWWANLRTSIGPAAIANTLLAPFVYWSFYWLKEGGQPLPQP